MTDAKVQSTIYISTGYTDTNSNFQSSTENNDFDHIYALTMPSTSAHRNTAQLLDSLTWLEGVPNTPSPLSFDDFGLDWEQPQQQTSLSQDFLLDPPLFPSPTTTFFNNTALLAPSPANSQSQQSSLFGSLSPSSSTTLDADSLLSFDTMAAPVTSQGQGAMSDAEFQLLLDGLLPEDVAAMLPTTLPCEPFVPVPMPVPIPMPMPALPVDNFALHAFPSLDLFTPSMDVVPGPVPVPVVPVPAPSPVPSADAAGQGSGSFRCRTCHRAYPALCRLRKHEHTHTRPFACTVCLKGHAAKKDLYRHLWSTHPDEAAAMNIPTPMRVCPVAGCGFESRQDNLTRHIRTKHANCV